MSELRTVLATREVPSLLGTSLFGRLPTAMATLGLLQLVRGDGGDYTLAGALAALFTAGTSVGQPMLARVVDRRGQRAVLLASALVSAAGFGVLAVSGAQHAAISAVAATAAGLATPPLEPCLRALWPHVVAGGSVLRAAFSLDVGLQEIIFVVGPLLAVAAVSLIGHAGAVLACAAFALAGTAAFAATTASGCWRPQPHSGDAHGSPLRHPLLVRVFLVSLTAGVPVGALPLFAATFAGLRHTSSLTGWVLAANAAGALTSGLWGAVRPNPHSGARMLAAAGLAHAVLYLPLAIVLPTPAWLVAAFVSGLALPVVLGVVFQRIQLRCPPNLMTEANAWVVTSFGLGAAVAALLAGIVTDRVGAHAAITSIVLCAAVFTTLVCATSYRPDPH